MIGLRLSAVAALAFMAMPLSVSAQSSDAEPEECANLATQMQMTACAGRRAAVADGHLNALWPRVVAEMRRRDAAGGRPDGRISYYQAVLRAQRAWLAWRDAECVVTGYDARGGSMEPMLVAFCQEEVTNTRIEQLTMLVEDRD
jgi:uncharacterized protein YecT (DUF1311 family)